MSTINISAANLANISAKLDELGASLSVEEKGLLDAVFQAAAATIHEVSGYALNTGVSLGGTFAAIFASPAGTAVSAAVPKVAKVDAVVTPGGAGLGLTIPGIGGLSFVL